MSADLWEPEALSEVGLEFVTVSEWPEAPLGTRARAVSAKQGGVRGWVVRLEWVLPPKRSEMLAQISANGFTCAAVFLQCLSAYSRSQQAF
jgi:hypothetical protein